MQGEKKYEDKVVLGVWGFLALCSGFTGFQKPQNIPAFSVLKDACIFLLATRDVQLRHQPYMELLVFLGMDLNTHNRLVQHLFSINQRPLLTKSINMSPEG